MSWAFVDESTREVVLRVRVTPRSRHTGLSVEQHRLRVRIAAPPADGKANKALIELLAQRFGVAKSAVRLRSGERHRDKTVAIVRPIIWPNDLPNPIEVLSCDASAR
jgi:uncharacterized protein (TIGR00251 family)